MPISHDPTTRTELSQVILGFVPVAVDIYDAGGNVLISFPNPVFTNTGGTVTLNASITANGAANGTAARCRLRNSSGTRWQNATDVSTAAGHEIRLSNLSIATGQPCTLQSYTFSAPN